MCCVDWFRWIAFRALCETCSSGSGFRLRGVFLSLNAERDLRRHAWLETLHRGFRFTRPPLHKLTESFFERHVRLEADLALRLLHVRQPPPDGSRLPFGTIFSRPVDA